LILPSLIDIEVSKSKGAENIRNLIGGAREPEGIAETRMAPLWV